jgi:hypothetical protein
LAREQERAEQARAAAAGPSPQEELDQLSRQRWAAVQHTLGRRRQRVEQAEAKRHCPGRRGRLSAIRVFVCKSVLYGAFVWARRALAHQKRRFPARADAAKRDAAGKQTAAAAAALGSELELELNKTFGEVGGSPPGSPLAAGGGNAPT